MPTERRKSAGRAARPAPLELRRRRYEPHSEILKHNLDAQYNNRRYREQEKVYLDELSNYRNRYGRADDDDYEKDAVASEDYDESEGEVDDAVESAESAESAEGAEGAESAGSAGSAGENADSAESAVEIAQATPSQVRDLAQRYGLPSAPPRGAEYAIDDAVMSALVKKRTQRRTHAQTASSIEERMEWQAMLRAALTGDVVRGEKTKLSRRMDSPGDPRGNAGYLKSSYREDLWLGIRAKLRGRTVDEQRRVTTYSRGLVDEMLSRVMEFKLEMPLAVKRDSYSARVRWVCARVGEVVDGYGRCEELWKTHKEMESDKPVVASAEFVRRMDALVAWSSVSAAIQRETEVLRRWVGNDDLDILRQGGADKTDKAGSADKASSAGGASSVSSAGSADVGAGGAVNSAPSAGGAPLDTRSFVERIMNEKDIKDVFNRRLFASFTHWTFKAKQSYLVHHEYFQRMGLPSYLEELLVLARFPCKLMKALINTRLAYLRKIRRPTLMMIDQVLEDLRTYLELSLDIRISFFECCSPVDGWISAAAYHDRDFDTVVMRCLRAYMKLLGQRLLGGRSGRRGFRTFKEPEELQRQWLLLQNVGFYVDGTAVEVCRRFSVLTSKLAVRLNGYEAKQLAGPAGGDAPASLDKESLARWVNVAIETTGQVGRKLARFATAFCGQVEDTQTFELARAPASAGAPPAGARLMKLLQQSHHVLCYDQALAQRGIYVFASEALARRPFDVVCLLRASRLGVDFAQIPRRHLEVMEDYTRWMRGTDGGAGAGAGVGRRGSAASGISPMLATSDSPPPYALVLVPDMALEWGGPVVPLETEESVSFGPCAGVSACAGIGAGACANASANHMTLICNGGQQARCAQWLRQCVGDAVVWSHPPHTQCSVPAVQRQLVGVRRLFLRMELQLLDSVAGIRKLCRKVSGTQELVNGMFVFVKEQARNFLRGMRAIERRGSISAQEGARMRATLVRRLMDVAIEWLGFVVDDCVADDQRTFRYSVAAMELAMDVTSGTNILALEPAQFARLKKKVAGSMALLISHFDIMGARMQQQQRESMAMYGGSLLAGRDMVARDSACARSRQARILAQLRRIESARTRFLTEQRVVGRVLDAEDSENQLLAYLASSFSSVSIQWQKGRFIGGGTFGSVYESVNLDTGGPMAVKEIRLQGRRSISTVVPAIRDEMSVLQMLSHPNIVQFFGVEVHRDRVFIFMEYCSGGSLAQLLEYGRIEDESIVQIYALQMLEGLAYLHQFGIVHCDIKPANILLDHLGVVKIIDFGSSKVYKIGAGGASGSGGSSAGANGSGGGSAGANGSGGSSAGSAGKVSAGKISAGAGKVGAGAGVISAATTGGSTCSPASPSIASSSTDTTLLSPRPGSNPVTPRLLESPVFSPGSTGTSTLSTPSTAASTVLIPSHNMKGTPMYMSPEGVRGGDPGRLGAIDIWAFGCCVLEMVTGHRPWADLDNEFAVLYHIAAGHTPILPGSRELSRAGRRFLRRCFDTDPYRRASAVELLQDPWMQSIRREAFSEPKEPKEAKDL